MSSVAAVSTAAASLEDREDEFVENKSNSNSELCIRCRYIDFQYVGYHDSAQNSCNNYSVQRQYPTLLESSRNCVFCHKVVDIVNDWFAHSSAEKTNGLDLSRAQVDITLETDWHTVTEKNEDDRETHSTRIRIHWSIPRVDGVTSRKSQLLTFFIQRYEDPPSDRSMLPCDPTSQTITFSSISQPYAGRKRSLIADLSLFNRWKSLCQEFHGPKCSQVFSGSSEVQPRVIDVNQRCITLANKDSQWVCLSYVWGKRPVLRLLKSNLEDLSVPGSLHQNALPNVIEDALQVTKGLEERYLWVDSLCITQDDDLDKAKFIDKMDSIYSLASVVIVATTCVDAHSYLPGVRPGSRGQIPEPFTLQSIQLIQSLDPVSGVGIDLRTGRTAAYLGETIWDTRAWTLQERFLASRSLVFTAEQVFWECEEGFWCEDSFREVPNILPDPHRSSLCGGNLNLSWNAEVVTFDLYYRTLLEEYSGRTLTFESDGLNAFAGIVRAFEWSTKETFIWGMPSAYLESALAWSHQSETFRRRRAPSGSDVHFPSWSWVGWVSEENSKLSNQHLTTELLGLEFYCISTDGIVTQRLKQRVSHNDKVDLLSEGSDLPNRPSRPSTLSAADLPRHPTTISSSLLCFWTVSTTLNVSHHSKMMVQLDSDSYGWETGLAQRRGQNVRVSWSQIPNNLEQVDQIEIIAVAQNRGDWDNGHIANGAIGVMIISWTDGIAYREGFAWIAIRDWTALEHRTWKLIVLG